MTRVSVSAKRFIRLATICTAFLVSLNYFFKWHLFEPFDNWALGVFGVAAILFGRFDVLGLEKETAASASLPQSPLFSKTSRIVLLSAFAPGVFNFLNYVLGWNLYDGHDKKVMVVGFILIYVLAAILALVDDRPERG